MLPIQFPKVSEFAAVLFRSCPGDKENKPDQTKNIGNVKIILSRRGIITCS
jgi:hypothetical protein